MKLFFALLFFFLSRNAFATEITSFSPTGTIKKVHQVKVLFSDSMVSFGDPQAKTNIFKIDCPKAGKARWLDDRTYVYEFDKKLSAGVKCRFRLKNSLRDLAGKRIKGRKRFSFSTGGPAIHYTRPYRGASIDEKQIFILTPDGNVDLQSVKQKLYFIVEGIENRVPAQILSSKNPAIQEILQTTYRYSKPPKNLIFVRAKRTLANGKKVTIVWSKGIRSTSGVATTQDQFLKFKVRPPFLARFRCHQTKKNQNCSPLSSVAISFTSPVAIADAKKIRLRSKRKTWSSNLDKKDNQDQYTSYIYFPGPFPAQTKFTLDIPAQLQDEIGRKLANSKRYPLQFQTDEFPPLARFAARFGILEAKTDALLPVTVRNLEQNVKIKLIKINPDNRSSLDKLLGRSLKVDAKNLVKWLRRVYSSNSKKSIFPSQKDTNQFKLPKPNSQQKLEVVGIPLREPGFYALELESKILGNSYYGKGKRAYIPTTALVTNIALHLKWGQENSLVWATSLDKGEPVAGVKISVRDCQNTLLASGETNATGVLILNNDSLQKVKNCSYKTYDNGLFVIGELGGDISFTHSNWNRGIEAWRYNLPTDYYDRPVLYHSVLDRTLLRAGETLHMKHYMRSHNMQGFDHLDASAYPENIKIRHLGSNQSYRLKLDWQKNGTAELSWHIPKQAKLGNYQIIFEKNQKKSKYKKTYYSANFRVEEFRVPLMKAKIQPVDKQLIGKSNTDLDIQVEYLSGGGAAKLPVKFKSFYTNSHYINFSDYEQYRFGSQPTKAAKKLSNSYSASSDSLKQKIQKISLDSQGGARIHLNDMPRRDYPFRILTELEFMDPNGEIQTISKTMVSYPSQVLVGIKQDSWASKKDKIKLYSIALDPNGKPLANQTIRIEYFQKTYFSNRKRLVGGFYAYEHYQQIKKIAEFCRGKTDNKGLLICEGSVKQSGDLIFQAIASDAANHKSYASIGVWVAGEDSWFAGDDHDRMDLIPLKKEYKTGDVAKLQARVPYKTSTALVSVEREGILDYSIQTLQRSNPFVSVAIQKNYSPNIFVSVLAVRGRIANIRPTSKIDLGKPSYKLGYANLNIDWQPHRLQVQLKTDKKVYQVRQPVELDIRVKPPTGSNLRENTEVAIAVIDEGLLELKSNQTWQLLQEMMKQRGLAVRTATAQMQVVGRRHFGSKAVESGGGGGQQNTRELFDTLIYWNPKVIIGEDGRAKIRFKLNDSLTSFRVVAIGHSGKGLFGTGSSKIRTTQDLMLISGIPPVAREGDSYSPTFTLRNTTRKAMTVQIKGTIQPIQQQLNEKTIALSPGEAREVHWPVHIPNNTKKLIYHVVARSQKIRDGIRIEQEIVPYIQPTVQQATLFQLNRSKQIPINFPLKAIRGKGGINIIYRPSLLVGIKGVKRYMKNYPYTCLEQKVSRAITLNDRQAWQKIMASLPGYMDSDGLVKYFPTSRNGSPILSAYLLAIADEANYTIPKTELNRMIYGLKRFINGSLYRKSSLSTPDLTIRKLSVMEALARYAVLKRSQFNSLKINLNLLPTSAILDYWNIVHSIDSDNRSKLRRAENIIRARLDMQGTTMKFSTERNDNLYWLMVSPDSNSVRLILTLLKTKRWQNEMGKIVRGALERHKKGSWDLTTANAWGSLAIRKFSQTFEKESVRGLSIIQLNRRKSILSWKRTPQGKDLFVKWPKTRNRLKLTHRGKGRPWVIVQSLAAIPRKKAYSSGFTITKKYIPIEVKQKGKMSKGDIYRIQIKVRSHSSRAWVVLDDPIPTGATILGSGLGRDSQMATAQESRSSVWPEYVERSFSNYRAYYRYVPSGRWSEEYTIRLNQDGKFQLPATRVEAMYSPEMFGEYPNATMNIQNR